MQLDQLTVHIRPLSPYQSLELGMVIARSWFGQLSAFWWHNKAVYLLFFLIAVTFILGFTEYAGFGNIWILLLLIVLVRLNTEIKMMILISQKVFDDTADINSTMDFLKNTKRPTLKGLKLVFSPSRIISLAVILLENQPKENKGKRTRQLLKGSHNAIWRQSAVFFCIEMTFFFSALSLIVLVLSFSPYSQYMMSGKMLDFLFRTGNGNLVMCVVALLYMAVCFITTPFFVGSSFALYLCRRSLLEGWDIELEFRQMASRYQELNKKELNLKQSNLNKKGGEQ